MTTVERIAAIRASIPYISQNEYTICIDVDKKWLCDELEKAQAVVERVRESLKDAVEGRDGWVRDILEYCLEPIGKDEK